jgi:zinc/manganese transport system substrate-binding protein
MRIVLAVLCALVLVPSAGASSRLQVVAAENVWGSIAAQLGGDRVAVTSIVSSPSADPHDYEPTSFDARALAGAKLAIVNGIGYDPWAQKLLDANPTGGRIVLDVGKVTGVKTGGNPHRWYSPADVRKVVAAIAAAYAKLDPRDAGFFRSRQQAFEARGLARYFALIATIRSKFHGVRVGASESIFQPLAQALGLDLVTPASFLRAISEGAEPTAADTSTIDRQIATRQVAVWVENGQNRTPDVQRITDAARRKGIPVVEITETLVPSTASFQDWQVAQLGALLAALQR